MGISPILTDRKSTEIADDRICRAIEDEKFIVNESVIGELDLLPGKQYKVWTASGKAGGNLLGEGTYDLNSDGNLVWKTGHYQGYNPATFRVIGPFHQLQISPRGYARNELKEMPKNEAK